MVEGVNIVSHKCILQSRAPMLFELAESENFFVKSLKCSVTALKISLQWIYTGSLSVTDLELDVAMEIINLSISFKLPGLQLFLEDVIISNVNEGNVRLVLDSAIANRVENIVSYCSWFVVSNFSLIRKQNKGDTRGTVLSPFELNHIFTHLEVLVGGGHQIQQQQRLPQHQQEQQQQQQTNSSQTQLQLRTLQFPSPPQPLPPPPPPSSPSSREIKTLPLLHDNRQHQFQLQPQQQLVLQPKSQKLEKHQLEQNLTQDPLQLYTKRSNAIRSTDGFEEVNDILKDVKRHVSLCKCLIKEMMSLPIATEFCAPVDLTEYPFYTNYVSNPMDLSTVKKNLKSRSFLRLKDFAAAVRLVFNNARIFNMPDSSIYKYANSLAQIFEDKYNTIKVELGLPKSYDLPAKFIPPDDCPPIKNERRKSVQPCNTSKRRKTSCSTVKTNDYEMEEDKMEVLKKLESLQEQNNNRLLLEVYQIVGGLVTSEGENEVVTMEIDIYDLPNTTIQALKTLLKDYHPEGLPIPEGRNHVLASNRSSKSVDNASLPILSRSVSKKTSSSSLGTVSSPMISGPSSFTRAMTSTRTTRVSQRTRDFQL
eukprot:TRINITY_DN5823_c0_g1_i1.p1 TRINITY_DN5823_c0_g1~~TRINITY_DN5823_c0_g1_i1.p1  ORF type:complete len:592 (+),score=143.91 TRINITY_DN5823_c0_g1_i1:675-2450(+)